MRLEDALERTKFKHVATLVISSSIYNEIVKELMKTLSKNNLGLYVAANKGCEEYSDLLAETKGLYFLDVLPVDTTVTEHMKDRCLGKAPPTSLSQISIAIANILNEKKEIRFLVLDSVSSLFVYNDYVTTIKFLRSLAENMHQKGVFTLYLALEEETDPKLRAEFSQMSDYVLSVDYI